MESLSYNSEILYKAICAARNLHNQPDFIFEKEIKNIISNLDKINIKIYCENVNQEVPLYAHEGEDVCMDLVAQSIERKIDRYIVHTGIHVELPKYFQLNIYPRSSISKTDWYIPNSPGIGDSGYRGEILVVFRNSKGIDRDEFPFKEGDRVAQCQVIYTPTVKWQRVESINDLSPSQRGEGGYGSTGKA